jgi:class 3 adenylate cyclase/tetratricopeptide (TPR) repeat protein
VLLPYVPRLVADWIADEPDAQFRAVPGTMVFADLSGFTAMSERLSRLGRVGAEEVTDAIGGCFEELLAVAYDVGGGLLKFGGDALLLAFIGPDHCRRAVWAAGAMRARLREVGKLRTSAGNVTLRMSVGVHSGTFDCFLVGAPSRELLVTGPAASAVVAMEHDASAGQIVCSMDTMGALPPECAGVAVGEGVLLRRVPERPPTAAALRADDAYDIDMRAVIPSAVYEHVDAGGGTAEHRVVTIAFVHFDGLDARLAHDGPPATADALHELVTIVEDACIANDVALLTTDVDADGGKFVLAAGAPAVRGHDEARMLATVRRIVDAQPAIPVRVGVNRGAVFAGDVGPHYRRTYTVMGDAVNLAARLMAAAEPGTVVATADVLDRAPGFAAEALPPLRVKGKKAPIQAYVVGAHRAEAETADTTALAHLPLIGRDAEITRFEQLLAGARTGRGAFVRVVGPAGIGKSRLVHEVRDRAHDFKRVAITCEAYAVATPYATAGRLLSAALDVPVGTGADATLAVLRDTVSRYAPELVPWLPLIAPVVGADLQPTVEVSQLAPQFRAARAASATADLLAALMEQSTLIVIDDAEWMDEASREIVDAFGALVGDRSTLLVAVAREDTPQDASHADAIVVGPLPREDVEAALRAATEHDPMRPHEIAILAERSGGNPLFLAELWRAARSGDVSNDALPDSIETLITVQLDRLPPVLRRALGYAAVLGKSFDRADVEAVVADDDVMTADTWRALSDFFEYDGASRARFRHGLLRDAAYAKLPFRRRRELHERAARMLERRLGTRAEAEGELLSLHFIEAHAFADAWRYARVAADRAFAKYANVDAAVLYERALAAARRVDSVDETDVAAVRESLGDVHDRNGEYEMALVNFRAARKLIAGDPVREAELLMKEALAPQRIGRYADALRTIRKGLQRTEGIDGEPAARARAQLIVWYADVRQAQGRHREAIAWSERAIAEADTGGDLEAEAHARFVLDWAHSDLGELDRVVNLDRAHALYEQIGDLGGQGAVSNLEGACAYWRGDWNGAVACYGRAREEWGRAGASVDRANASATSPRCCANKVTSKKPRNLRSRRCACTVRPVIGSSSRG